eukprot:g4037.t1
MEQRDAGEFDMGNDKLNELKNHARSGEEVRRWLGSFAPCLEHETLSRRLFSPNDSALCKKDSIIVGKYLNKEQLTAWGQEQKHPHVHADENGFSLVCASTHDGVFKVGIGTAYADCSDTEFGNEDKNMESETFGLWSRSWCRRPDPSTVCVSPQRSSECDGDDEHAVLVNGEEGGKLFPVAEEVVAGTDTTDDAIRDSAVHLPQETTGVTAWHYSTDTKKFEQQPYPKDGRLDQRKYECSTHLRITENAHGPCSIRNFRQHEPFTVAVDKQGKISIELKAQFCDLHEWNSFRYSNPNEVTDGDPGPYQEWPTSTSGGGESLAFSHVIRLMDNQNELLQIEGAGAHHYNASHFGKLSKELDMLYHVLGTRKIGGQGWLPVEDKSQHFGKSTMMKQLKEVAKDKPGSPLNTTSSWNWSDENADVRKAAKNFLDKYVREAWFGYGKSGFWYFYTYHGKIGEDHILLEHDDYGKPRGIWVGVGRNHDDTNLNRENLQSNGNFAHLNVDEEPEAETGSA